MPLVGTATECVPESVIPWLTRSDVFAPVSGRVTPLVDEVGTNATPRAVNDGSCGVVTAAYETPAVAAKSAALATISAGEGRRRSLRMDGPLPGVVGRDLPQDAPSPRIFPGATRGGRGADQLLNEDGNLARRPKSSGASAGRVLRRRRAITGRRHPGGPMATFRISSHGR